MLRRRHHAERFFFLSQANAALDAHSSAGGIRKESLEFDGRRRRPPRAGSHSGRRRGRTQGAASANHQRSAARIRSPDGGAGRSRLAIRVPMADGTQSARESHRTLRGGNIRFTDRVRERRNALSRPSCGTPARVWRPSSSRVVPAAHNAAIVDGELAAIHFWRAFRSAPGNRKHSLPERNESGGASTWEPHHNQLADSCIYGSPRHFEYPAIRPCARVESVAFRSECCP